MIRANRLFFAGVRAVAARAPGLVASHLPVNPVVVAAYAAMAFLCRAYLMAMAFPRRGHGLTVDVENAAAFARACATSINAFTYAHADLLSGRNNKTVLRAFLSLYAVAQLGGLLNSTWMVVAVLWVTAFTVPYAVEMNATPCMRSASGASRRLADDGLNCPATKDGGPARR